jgi:ATPase subunit of ABC transporter with duplicated ATPase domains
MAANPKIGIVGPCSAGKSTLVQGLKARGYPNTRPISQEHSYVPDMWQRITHPDVLIYLDVSYENAQIRRWLNWTVDEYTEQLRRLQHARQHAHLYVDTNPLSVGEVLEDVLRFLDDVGHHCDIGVAER